MTPAERYEYDVNGYLLIEDAITPEQLSIYNARLDEIEADRVQFYDEGGEDTDPVYRLDNIINLEPVFVPLVTNPIVLPYIVEMVENPRLKSTWATFKWKNGGTGFHSNHTPTVTHNQFHFNTQLRHNLFQVFYAMKDIGKGEGALQVIPGSHKANYPITGDLDLEHMKIEIPMKAGSVLLFTHDMHHGSVNTSDNIRRTIIFTYCPGVIANSFGGDTLYEKLFNASPEHSWQKYLLRQPNGFRETYPQPSNL